VTNKSPDKKIQSTQSSKRKTSDASVADQIQATGLKTKSPESTTKRKTKVTPKGKGQVAQRKPRSGKTTKVVASKTKRPDPSISNLPRLLPKFRKEVTPALMKEFGYRNVMQVPKLEKLVLNARLGKSIDDPKALESISRDIALISGQKPVTTRAKKAIAGFKIREGMALGVAVTVRGNRMYELFDKLVNTVLPRIRDFRGVPRESFDGRGSYSLGIREQVIFPEIDYNTVNQIRGLQVVIVTTAHTDREGLKLLELLGMPFVRDESVISAT